MLAAAAGCRRPLPATRLIPAPIGSATSSGPGNPTGRGVRRPVGRGRTSDHSRRPSPSQSAASTVLGAPGLRRHGSAGCCRLLLVAAWQLASRSAGSPNPSSRAERGCQGGLAADAVRRAASKCRGQLAARHRRAVVGGGIGLLFGLLQRPLASLLRTRPTRPCRWCATCRISPSSRW